MKFDEKNRTLFETVPSLSISHGPEIFAEFTDDFRLTFEVDFDGMVTQPIAVTGPRASSPFGDKQLHHLESLTTSACVTRLPPPFFLAQEIYVETVRLEILHIISQ